MDDESSVDTAMRRERPEQGGTHAIDLLSGLVQQTEAWAFALESARRELLGIPPPQRSGPHRTGRDGAADPTAGGEAAPSMLADALARAESTVTLVDPGSDAPWLWPPELERLTVATLRRGCTVRAMFGRYPWCREAQRIAVAVDSDQGTVRIADTPAFPMIVVDALVVLAPHAAAESDSAPTIAAIATPGVVRLLRDFTDLTWEHAEPDHDRAEKVPLWSGSNVELKKSLVELLATGAKDERIARTLGISLRTCRRHIAEILSELGARSRFQAGANAAHVGLIATGRSGGQRVRRRPGPG